MKDLAQHFLTEAERTRVENAVKAAEKRTAGEIVVMIISASYQYPLANVIGATAFALPLALLLTPLTGSWLWIGPQNMWLFLGFLTVFFIIFHEVVKRTAWLKRLFISQREIDDEVEEAAVTQFFDQDLYRTRDETGVLVLISVFERRVWMLADRGINAKVQQNQWDDIVTMITEGIKQERAADAICAAVEKIGDLLEAHFPLKPDDTNELKNLVIEK
ncbi:MAG: TPM domain-containing protein [Deltaproteobacteria bacterium]|jgi:putative membrane protein|nr:TPM domain-containing protein [Deltaproteobacteria bacterium]MBW2488242.1 TPM domain-containing protein [Deltaproteobacteria bacterium]